MSCKSRWTGPKDESLEAQLRASIDRAQRSEVRERDEWSIGFPSAPLAVSERLGKAACDGSGEQTAVTPPSAIADTLSPSQALLFMDCPARWHYQYVKGYPSYATGKQVRGTAVHGLVGYWFSERMKGHTPEPETLRDAYEEIWDAAAEGAVFKFSENIEDLKLTGAQLAAKYIAERGEAVKPTAIELKVQGKIGGVNVRGYVDVMCATDDGRIIDLKTTSRTPSGVSAGHALQLATYARLTPGATGLVQLDTLVANKTPKLVSIEYQIPDADIKLTEVLYPRIQKSMRSGFYHPNRGSIYCSRANCSFADACCAEFGGIVE